jgi:hypothetical protein
MFIKMLLLKKLTLWMIQNEECFISKGASRSKSNWKVTKTMSVKVLFLKKLTFLMIKNEKFWMFNLQQTLLVQRAIGKSQKQRSQDCNYWWNNHYWRINFTTFSIHTCFNGNIQIMFQKHKKIMLKKPRLLKKLLFLMTKVDILVVFNWQ